MSLLAAFGRILLVLLALRLFLRFFVNLVHGYRTPERAPGPRRPDLVRDRICNTFIPRERSVRASVHGREEHFCSVTCRDRALADART